MHRNEIVRRSWALFEPELLEQGYELVELEYVKQGRTGILRVYIDHNDGITHTDCAAVSQVLGPILDMDDFIAEAYVLEVSSPGVDRPVRKPEDFTRFTGETLKLSTITATEGRRRYTGTLKGYDDGLISIECDGRTHQVHIENLKKANLLR